MEPKLLQELLDKSITKEELVRKVENNFSLLPELILGIASPKARVRYGSSKILMDLSGKHPEKIYSYMDVFTKLLESKHRILVWNATAIIANLARVDKDKKFDYIFEKYYSLLSNEYLVTVANVVSNSAKIALAKPYMTQRITTELLTVENVRLTTHLTEECKRVIAEKAVDAFDVFFNQVEDKKKVLEFVKRQTLSPRASLKVKAERFLVKWDK